MSACDLEIFSHRGLSGDAKVDRPLLTESALLGLATRGIRNFDLDLSFSTDGMLLVAHPAVVQQAMKMMQNPMIMEQMKTMMADPTVKARMQKM